MRTGSFRERSFNEIGNAARCSKKRGKKEKYRDFTPRRFGNKIEGFATVDSRPRPRIPIFQRERLLNRIVSQISSLHYAVHFEERESCLLIARILFGKSESRESRCTF